MMRKLIVVLLLLAAGTASAQPEQRPASQTEGETSSAAPSNGTSAPETSPPETSPPEAESSAETEAVRRYTIAIERADQGDCEAAIAEFAEVYRLLEGDPRRPNFLFNMGVCYEQLLRYDDALSAYERYLNEAQPEAEARREVERNMRRLTAMLARLEIRANVPAEVWIDGRRAGAVEQGPEVVTVTPGQHLVELRAAGYESNQQEITLASGVLSPLSFTLAALNDFDGISPAWVWVGVGLTGALAAGALTSGIITLARQSEIDGRDVHTAADNDYLAPPRLATDILLAAAGALAITTVVLAVSADWEGDDDETAGVRIRVRAGLTSMQLEGEF